MNKMYRILLFSLSILAIAACGKTGGKSGESAMTQMLTRTAWRFDDRTTLQESGKLELNDYLREGVQATTTRFRDAFFEFKADSTLTITTREEVRTGKWMWTKFEGKPAVIFQFDGTRNSPVPVDTLGDNILVLGINQAEGTYFKRYFSPVDPKE